MNLEFQGLKFKISSFDFKNKSERNKYFTDLLAINDYLFLEKQKQYFTEKLHILLSYAYIFQILGFVFLGLALLMPFPFKLGLAITGLLYFYISFMLNRKLKNDLTKYIFTLTMYEIPEFLEMLKEENKQ